MESNKLKIGKVNAQSKLSLKRSNSDSSQSNLHMNNSPIVSNDDCPISCEIIQTPHKENITNAPNGEDSLADFKSPKEETRHRPILRKFKIDTAKVKKKLPSKKSKTSIKSKTSNSDLNQPLIESSFFKPQNSNQDKFQESVPCPLCLKPFKDNDACTNHMKICAAKNNVSIRQLLDAKQLQERQAEERKAMGLLGAPVLPEKKKVYRSKNFSTGDDPQLQLVLAMSESLYEAEQMIELEQAALLAGISSECIKFMNDDERRKTLQNFGFTTNKPASEVPNNKSRKKKLLAPTVLQTRSQEDKDRVLTERIACILTGDDAFTQVQEKSEIFSRENTTVVLRSNLLKNIEKVCDKLWDKSRLTKRFNNFYVKELKPFLLQSKQPHGSESIDSELLLENFTLSNSSVEYEPKEINEIINQDTEKNNSYSSNMSELDKLNDEYDSSKSVLHNWGEALNNCAESDIIIFVKDAKYIYAHKLVFYVQCPAMLKDIKTNDTNSHLYKKEMICWPDKDQLPTLAFLEFIYCGSVNKYISVFDDDDLVLQITQLASLYNVKGLLTYLTKKQNDKLKNVREILVKSLEISRQETTSPDIFESENEEELFNSSKEISKNVKENNANFNEFITLSDDDGMENNASKYMNEFVIDENTARSTDSQDTIINLNSKSNSEKDNLSMSSSQENIHEALTPKTSRSPIMYNEITPKKLNYKINRSAEKKVNLSSRKKTYDEDKHQNEMLFTTTTIEVDNIKSEKSNSNTDLIHDVVTPQKTDETQNKPKSDISLFIEKIRRINSKSIDSDSDMDAPEIYVKKCNPFSKRNRNDSYRYLQNDGQRSPIHRRRISCIEQDALESAKNEMSSPNEQLPKVNEELYSSIEESSLVDSNKESSNQSVKINVSNNKEFDCLSNSDDEVDIVTVDESEMSRYSKYKSRKKFENSINEYRRQLNFDSKQNNDNKSNEKNHFNEFSVETDKDKNLLQNDTGKIKIIEDITLVGDSDDEDNDDSVPKLKNNSITESKKKDNESDCAISNIENDSTFPLDLLDSEIEQPNTKIKNSTMLQENSKNNVLDTSLNSRKGDIHDDSTFPYDFIRELDDNQKNKEYDKKNISSNDSKKSKQLEMSERKSNECDYEVSKILEWTPEFIDLDTTTDENHDKSYINQQEVINLSPITIQTSPKVCKLSENDRFKSDKDYVYNKEANESKKIQNELFDSNDISLIPSTSHSPKILSPTSSPLLSQRKENIQESIPRIDYSKLKSPELKEELNKYGIKPLARPKAIRMLTRITEVLAKQQLPKKRTSSITSSSEDEPPPKKQNIKEKSKTTTSNSNNKLRVSKSSQNSLTIADEIGYDKRDTLKKPTNMSETFINLIVTNKNLYTKVLTYEPLIFESLHLMFKEQGCKCSAKSLKDFLDEQCITYQEQIVRGKQTKTQEKIKELCI